MKRDGVLTRTGAIRVLFCVALIWIWRKSVSPEKNWSLFFEDIFAEVGEMYFIAPPRVNYEICD